MPLHLFFSAGAAGPFGENNPVAAGDVPDSVPPVVAVESPEASSPSGSPAADPHVSSSVEAEEFELLSPASALDDELLVLSHDGESEGEYATGEVSESGSDYMEAPKATTKKAGRPKKPPPIYLKPVDLDSGPLLLNMRMVCPSTKQQIWGSLRTLMMTSR